MWPHTDIALPATHEQLAGRPALLDHRGFVFHVLQVFDQFEGRKSGVCKVGVACGLLSRFLASVFGGRLGAFRSVLIGEKNKVLARRGGARRTVVRCLTLGGGLQRQIKIRLGRAFFRSRGFRRRRFAIGGGCRRVGSRWTHQLVRVEHRAAQTKAR